MEVEHLFRKQLSRTGRDLLCSHEIGSKTTGRSSATQEEVSTIIRKRKSSTIGMSIEFQDFYFDQKNKIISEVRDMIFEQKNLQ